jgi:hypothetical protein
MPLRAGKGELRGRTGQKEPGMRGPNLMFPVAFKAFQERGDTGTK